MEILTTAWSGEPVRHHGGHYTVDDLEFLPRPVQHPGIPVWVAGFPCRVRPIRRAARYEGFFPINLEHPDKLAEAVAAIAELRRDRTSPFDVVAGVPAGADPVPYAEAGATWWLPELDPEAMTLDQVKGVLRDGPLAL
jgi:alkanesulfonate monooxygenase SsuD/methylene tetrahydromethanopterin reductase-like flavin-dependent oxidoreductase (luciferase family)